MVLIPSKQKSLCTVRGAGSLSPRTEARQAGANGGTKTKGDGRRNVKRTHGATSGPAGVQTAMQTPLALPLAARRGEAAAEKHENARPLTENSQNCREHGLSQADMRSARGACLGCRDRAPRRLAKSAPWPKKWPSSGRPRVLFELTGRAHGRRAPERKDPSDRRST
ncbi:unnamed protein product [Prorocentrum cordatum]|uniref:Uncharacterized protein n=1 Tax=Prorocentrum cordatum TaxID=2364126 RepID=A0ABN9TIB4_9DINO|nr:unnamed protein product [Polarella glacialis]